MAGKKIQLQFKLKYYNYTQIERKSRIPQITPRALSLALKDLEGPGC